MKQDIREYSDSELSLWVFNDEGLYRMRKNRNFVDILKEYFIFTEEQLNELLSDLESEKE